MKVYVDELPKSCERCPLCECNGFDNNGWCKAFGDKLVYIADKTFKGKRLQSCPLQSLSDYTKQVRKEVVQEIKDNILKEEYFDVNSKGEIKYIEIPYRKFLDFLNQIQGEDK